MENDSTGHFPTNSKNDKEIIKEILAEKERDADVVHKMYGLLYENLDQVQAVWVRANIVYNISGDISVDEVKKIIDSMNGGSETKIVTSTPKTAN